MKAISAVIGCFALALVLTLLPVDKAEAQTCGPGQTIIGMTPGGNGMAPMPICGDAGNGDSDAPASGSGGYTPPPPAADTSAALAYGRRPGEKGWTYWFTGNYVSQDSARAAALSYCQSDGGLDCKVVQAFTNGSVGIASSEDGALFSIAQPGFYEAQEGALKVCLDAKAAGCRKLMVHNSSSANRFTYGAYWGDRRNTP